MSDVVFVTMPFILKAHPSLGLSLLKPALQGAGIDCSIEYLNLEFAREAGDAYDSVVETRQLHLIGEWPFAALLFEDGARIGRDERFLREVVAPYGDDFTAEVLRMRSLAPQFLERWTERVLSKRPAIVGFTSSFAQHVPSLALARKLKRARPDLTILFGGSNCEGAMGAELVRGFDFVDAVVSGEADAIIVELAQRALRGDALDTLAGVYTVRNLDRIAREAYPTGPSIQDMDALPYPDFSDFVTQHKAIFGDAPYRLLFETARGCWWGAKHHCTFCGLNGSTMAFRSKSPQRALDEIERLVELYGTTSLGMVDNILDMRYLDSVIPALARRDLGLDLTIEVKANLKKEQLQKLRDAGARSLQPGIESLDTSVLKLMDKGVRAIANVALLKWCKELGIFPAWNLLWGFPDEDPSAYSEMAALIPLISHLEPPIGTGRVRLDRFSPNYDTASSRGIVNVRPAPAYELIYDLPGPSLANLAYYFEFDYARGQNPDEYAAPILQALHRWKEIAERSELIAIDFDDLLLVLDYRPDVRGAAKVFTGLERAWLVECDGIRSLAQLHALAASRIHEFTKEETRSRLAALVDAGLMMREGDAYLALAIPFGTYVPNEEVRAHMAAVVAAFAPRAA